MRETCARALAAALMTGAIAGVMAMSALFGPPSEAGRPITAPLSSLQRSVRVEVPREPPAQRTSVERRPMAAHSLTTTRARPVVVTRRLVIIRTRRVHVVRRQLASSKPNPQPAAPAAPAPEAAAPPAPVQPSPAPDEEAESGRDHGHGNGNGNAFGHEKDHGHEGGHEN